MPTNTAALRPGIVPLGASYGQQVVMSSVLKGGVRLAVTSRRLTAGEINNLNAAYGSRTPGKLRPGDVVNRKAWLRVINAEAGDFDIAFDDTPGQTSITAPGFVRPWGEGLGGNEVGPAMNVRDYWAFTWQERLDCAYQFGASDVFKRRGVVISEQGPDTDVTPWDDHLPFGVFPVSIINRPAWVSPANSVGMLMGFCAQTADYARVLGYMWGLYESSIPGGNVRASCRDYQVYTSRADYLVRRRQMIDLFGVTPGSIGDDGIARKVYTVTDEMWPTGYEWYTHPGGEGWFPALGLFFHAVHPNVASLQVRGWSVRRFVTEAAGEAIADYIGGQEPYVEESIRESVRLTAANLRTTLGGKFVRIIAQDEPMGPYDIYECAQIQKAFDDGAARSDIDEYKVSGKRCDVWRKENLARPPAKVITYVLKKEAGKSLVSVNVDFEWGADSGLVAVPLGPVPTLDADSVVLATRVNRSPSDPGVPQPSDEQAELALAALFPTARAVFMDTASASALDLYVKEAIDQPDMPFTWWQSSGMTGFEGVMKSFVTSLMVPVDPVTP